MALTTYIPGMAPGRTPRNLVVLVVYLLCFPVVPFVLAYAAFSNYNQISDRLAMRNTPGFTPGGGVKPAAVTLIVLLVTISLIASLGAAPFLVLADSGSGSQPSTQASADNEPDSGADNPAADEGGGDEERGEEAGEEETGNTADSDDGFGGESLMDGESFIDGGASASDNLSDEERAANTQALFEDMLTDNGYEVTDGEMDDGVIHIEYRTYAEDREEALSEIVEISGFYAGIEGVLRNELAEEEEYEGVFKEQTEGLHVTILDPNDVEQGTFSVESEWAIAFFNGEISEEEHTGQEISEEEYANRIEETIEIPDHFENSGEFGDSESDNNSSG